MASILTYNQVIDLLIDITKRHEQVNTFFLGRNWETENSEDILFPLFQVYPDFGKLTANSFNEYKTQTIRFVCKMLDLTTNGEENKRDVHSDTLRYAQDIVNEFNQHPFYMRSNIKLIGDVDFNEVLQEYQDDVTAGWSFNLTFQLININQFCGMPIQDIPGYSATGPESTGTIVNVQYLTCATLPNCPTIELIEDTLVDLQEQIDNLPPSALTLAQVLGYGNSTNNISITAGTNLSNILQVSDTVMGLSWNGTIGGNITLDDTGTYVYSDSDVNVESQSTVDITGPLIRLKLDDGFNITRLILNKDQTVSDTSTNNNLVIIDNISNKGIVYFDDYSANFTDNSLVTKAWVLAQTPAAPSLQTVISVSSVINGFLAQSLDNGTYITLTNSGIDMSSYDGTTTSGFNMYAATGNNLYSDTLNSLNAPNTIITSNQIKLTSTDNASVNIVSPAGFYYPALNFYNGGTNLLGSISGYGGALYIGGVGGTPMIVTGAGTIMNLETANTLTYLDGGKYLKSVTLGAGLSLASGTLSATLTTPTLAQVLTAGNSTGNQNITSLNTNNILEVSDTTISLNWNDTNNGSVILNNSFIKLTHDTFVTIDTIQTLILGEFHHILTDVSSISRIDTVAGSVLLSVERTSDGNDNQVYVEQYLTGIAASDISGIVSKLEIHTTQQSLLSGDPSTNNTMIITDAISNKGLVYVTDYSANFTENSLVTKSYTDGKFNLAEQLANKQNDLTIDGTGTKYPTVDAVNQALADAKSNCLAMNYIFSSGLLKY